MQCNKRHNNSIIVFISTESPFCIGLTNCSCKSTDIVLPTFAEPPKHTLQLETIRNRQVQTRCSVSPPPDVAHSPNLSSSGSPQPCFLLEMACWALLYPDTCRAAPNYLRPSTSDMFALLPSASARGWYSAAGTMSFHPFRNCRRTARNMFATCTQWLVVSCKA